jgi:S-adenosylmethionine:tRNA-ribosyltransferase-isomerase (queuine synthetase)
MDLYNYRRRLSNNTAMDEMTNTTKVIVDKTFHEAPNFKEIFLNGYKTDARINTAKDNNELTILFRPNTKVFKGDIINFDTTHWLVNNTNDNPIYPTAFVSLCNEWLRWIDDTGTTKVYPAVIVTKKYDLNQDEQIIVSENTLTILTPFNNDTKKIKHLQRFIINDIPYEIHGIDAISNVNLGKGYIELKAEQSLVTAEDNLDTDIANNDGSNWGAW